MAIKSDYGPSNFSRPMAVRDRNYGFWAYMVVGGAVWAVGIWALL